MATLSLLSSLQQSPYFDDYDETKKFLRMLFQPGVSLQVRELTQLQTILQNQISRLGDSFYKDGSIVTGGQINLNTNVSYIRLASTETASTFANQKIQLSGADTITFDVITTVEAEGSDAPVLIGVYSGSDTITTTSATIHIAGSIGISAQTADAGTITGDGSIASISAGIYYINGFFVTVDAQTIVLEKFATTPSYKVGLTITESITNNVADSSLLDNASGSFNVNAPGADRYKIALILGKKSLTTISEQNFIELLRVVSGLPTKIVKYPVYSALDDTLARRTYDESGNYTVKPFLANLNTHKNASGWTLASTTASIVGLESKFLKDFRIGDSVYLTNGSFNSATTTVTAIADDENMTVAAPIGSGQTQFIHNLDKLSVGLEPGKAYVRGYDYESVAVEYADVRKGRDTNNAIEFVMNTNFGNNLRIDNANGSFNIATHEPIDLHCVRTVNINTTSVATLNTSKIGTARPRQLDYFSGTPGATNGTYDLYLYDTKMSSITSNAHLATTAGETTLTLNNTTSTAVSNAYTGATVKMTSGYNEGVSRSISAYHAQPADPGGNIITLANAFLADIGIGDTCEIDFTPKLLESVVKVDPAAPETFANTGYADISQFGKVDQLDPNSFTKIFDTDRSSLIYELPQAVVKTLNPLVTSKFDYTVKQQFFSVTFNNGLASITQTGGVFLPGKGADLGSAELLNHVLCTVSDSIGALCPRNIGDIVNFGDGGASSVDAAGTSMALDTGVGSNDNFTATITTAISLSPLASTFRTKTIVNSNTTSFTSGDTNATLRGLGQYKATTAADYANTTISLRTSDVKSLKAIVKSPDDDIASLTTELFTAACASAGDTNNITDKYNFETGQRDNLYDFGFVKLKPGQSAPAVPIVAVFDYFAHQAADGPFTVDTYLGATAGVEFSDIPSYTSPITGKTVSLRDCLDFRPKRTNGDESASFALDSATINQSVVLPRLPDSDVVLTTDVQFYLPRKDKIVVTKDREFGVIEGNPSVDPIVPADDEDSMTIYIADIPEYTFEVTDVNLQYIENKRFTMRDIGKIEKRVEQLEYFTSLSFLEKDAKEQAIFTDGGVERFKNGILVDQFAGHAIGDVLDDDYRIAIDFDQTLLRPTFESDNFKFKLDVNSANIMKTGDLVSVAYTDTGFIDQPATTTTEEVNPFGSGMFNGILTMTNPSDTWFYDGRRPEVLINLTGGSDNWESGKYNYGFGTQWDNWSKNWSGVEINNDDVSKANKKSTSSTKVDRSAKTIDQQNTRDGILSKDQPESVKKTVNNKQVNDTIVSWNRKQTVLFKAQGLKPSTDHYLYVDGVNLTEQANTGVTLSITDGGNSEFIANEGEYVTVSANSSISGTLVHVDYTGNTTLMLANTIGDWTTTGTSTIVEADYVSASGTVTANATLSAVPTTYVNNLKSDINGTVVGNFEFTAGQFRMGERLVRLTDHADNTLSKTNSVAEKTFHIKGMESVSDGSIISTRSSLVRRQDIRSAVVTKSAVSDKSSSSNFVNPMAQSIVIDESRYPNGVFLRTVTFYFSQKDTYLPVTVQVRPMTDGTPSVAQVLPFGEKVLVPDEVTVDSSSPDTTKSSSGTTFKFPSPVYLPPGEFAIVLMTNSPKYKVYSSVEGNIVTNSDTTNTKAGKGPEVGDFFVTNNSSKWTPVTNRSLMFKTQKCSFQLTSFNSNLCQFDVIPHPLSNGTANTAYDLMKLSTSELKFSDSVIDYFYQTTTENAAYPHIAVRDNSFTKFTSNKNIKQDSRKTIRTGKYDGGADSDMKIQVKMSTTNSDVSPIIDLSRLNLITVENNINNGGISNNNVAVVGGGTGYANGTSNITLDPVDHPTGTGAAVTLVTDGTGAITDAYASAEGSGYFDNITATLSGGTSGSVTISAETDREGGNGIARYITRRVTLQDGFDAEDVRVYIRAYKPSTSNINIYYKALSSTDSESFDDKYWNKMTQETDSSVYSANESDFLTYNYKTADDSAAYTVGSTTFKDFKYFAIKVVLTSSSNIDPPKIKDLRAVALDS